MFNNSEEAVIEEHTELTMEQYIGWMEGVKKDLEALKPQDNKINQSAILALNSCIELANKVVIPKAKMEVEDKGEPNMVGRDIPDAIYDEFPKGDN